LGAGGIPSAAAGLREPPPRVVLDDGRHARIVATPQVAGVAHVILAVTDTGTPSLTSYRRIIFRIAAP
jgi:hypothetical protein